MTLFRLSLATCLIAIAAYTSVTVGNHGFNLLPVFFGAMAEMGWPGQFNLDFMGFLALSALWVAWRHQFSTGGLALAVLAFFGGMLFLSIYLLVHTGRARGDFKMLLLGEGRAA
ncbi:MAG: hypothetical protein ACKOW1_10320 [Novosphingobium sp.]